MQPPPDHLLTQLSREFAFVCTREGVISWVDERARRVLGLSAGENFFDRALPSDRDKAVRTLARVGTPGDPPLELTLDCDSAPVTVEVWGAPCDGGILFVGSVLADGQESLVTSLSEALSELSVLHRETARRRAELDRLLQALSASEDQARRSAAALAELDRQKDEFLAAVAHDLKNPLTAVRGFAQLLRRRLRGQNLDPWADEMLATIESTATKTSAMVDDLLDVARVKLGAGLRLRFAPVDLVTLVQRVAGQQLLSDRHRLRVEAPAAPLVGQWDATRLERVIDNLLSNAVKYSPAGGDVTIRLTEDPPGEWAVCSVQDEGIGIPPEDIHRIFESFYRARNAAAGTSGLGLGLAGARRIIEQHGGTLTAESRAGPGSIFTIRLPLAVSPPA